MSAVGKQELPGSLEQFKSRYWSRFYRHMDECERRLLEVTSRPGRTLGESCSLTLSAGGKRLRPLLVFLSAGKESGVKDNHYAAAVAVELVHMATLVHDDILDGAELRRGQPTLVARYGPFTSTAAGDYLFSSAFEILAQTGSPEAVSMLSETSLGLSRGELKQMEEAGNLGLTPEAYTERCRLKTSGLFSVSCRLGAMFSGCSKPTVGKMGEFGHCLGLAFQIFDDILDFSGEAVRTGKEAGADLRDGTVTLPLVFALQNDGSLGDLLRGGLSEERVSEICRRVKAAGGIDKAREQALRYVEQANGALSMVDSELDTAPLALIAGATVDRVA